LRFQRFDAAEAAQIKQSTQESLCFENRVGTAYTDHAMRHHARFARRLRTAVCSFAVVATAAASGCSSAPLETGSGAELPEAATSSSGAAAGGFGAGDAGATSSTTSGAGGAADSGGSGAAAGASSAATPDPDLPGPHDVLTIDDSVVSSTTGKTLAVRCAYPADATQAPYPVVLLGHGFQLPPSQYEGYLDRLASFGYVALSVDFQAGFLNPNHHDNAAELLDGLSWVAGQPMLAALADTDVVGATGHSLGGKLALMAARNDPRIQAVMALDPVDSGMFCGDDVCPDVSAMSPLSIPTGFIGESIDASTSCAPSEKNYDTFFATAAAPSLSVHVQGANHMSFLDDASSCGSSCAFCNAATRDNDEVTALARAMLTAFFEFHLKGRSDYQSYLDGPEAQQRYVDTGVATITVK
jgi:predicted dienelactone hydrolase